MSQFASKSVAAMKPYVPVSERMRQVNDQERVLKLDWNEATVAPSPKVAEAVLRFLSSERLQWYPATRNAELVQALAEYSNVSADCVQYFAGSDDLHEYVVRAFIDNGDTVLIVSPTYDSFRAVAESAGANAVHFWLNSEFHLDLEEFHRTIADIQPKVVYICNPNNPTGTKIPLLVLRKLVDAHHSSLFVLDEAYVEFGGETAAPL
jgi:histidinol-phosphate aminotransferase